MRTLIGRERLAAKLAYDDPDSKAMTRFLHAVLGVRPIPGRRGIYDEKAIDHALDQLSGLPAPAQANDPASAFDEWIQGNSK